MLCYGQRYISYIRWTMIYCRKLTANFRKCLPITYESYAESLPWGERGVKYLQNGYVLLLNVTFLDNVGWRSLWIREVMWPVQERRGSNIFFFGMGFSDGGLGTWLKSFSNGLTKVTLKSSFFFFCTNNLKHRPFLFLVSQYSNTLVSVSGISKGHFWNSQIVFGYW